MSERAWQPLDVTRWPSVGDEVLYRRGDDGGWQTATVLKVASHDGDLDLDTGEGIAMAALDTKHGPQPHGWLLWDEWMLADRTDPTVTAAGGEGGESA